MSAFVLATIAISKMLSYNLKYYMAADRSSLK